MGAGTQAGAGSGGPGRGSRPPFSADANPFLQSVHRCMASRLLQLPDKHSVTALLNTWAQSVHQACLSAA